MDQNDSAAGLWTQGFSGTDWKELEASWRLAGPGGAASTMSDYLRGSEAVAEAARWYWAGRGAAAAARAGGDEGPSEVERVEAVKGEALVDDALSFSENYSSLEPDAVFGLICGALGVGSAPMKEIMNLTRESAFAWQEGKMRRLRDSIEDAPWDSGVIWATERFGFCGGTAAMELAGASRALWERSKIEAVLAPSRAPSEPGKAPGL